VIVLAEFFCSLGNFFGGMSVLGLSTFEAVILLRKNRELPQDPDIGLSRVRFVP
jgi:hypothetical protein